jgi:hypothetical protein
MASSSSGLAAGHLGDTTGALDLTQTPLLAPVTSLTTLEAQPDYNLVHARTCMVSGNLVLTHQVTGEVVVMARPKPYILIECDGMAVVVNSDDIDPVTLSVPEEAPLFFASELFARSVWSRISTHSDGSVSQEDVLVHGQHGTALGRCVRLGAARLSADVFKVATPAVLFGSSLFHVAARFDIPRHGSRWWWRLADLHGLLVYRCALVGRVLQRSG